MKKRIICALIAMASALYVLGCIGRLDAGTVTLLGATTRGAVGSLVLWGALGGL